MRSNTEPLRLGFVAIARSTFDTSLARLLTGQARRRLIEAGFRLDGPAAPVETPAEAAGAARDLSQHVPDAIVIFQATFADARMALLLAESVDAPLLLWAVPETPAGGRLRLNSYCGVNLAAHALKRAGFAYDSLCAAPDDPSASDHIRQLALAGRVRRQLRGARIGLLGSPPDGFPTCEADQTALEQRFGVELIPLELSALFRRVESVDSPDVAALRSNLEDRLAALAAHDPAAVHRTLAAYLALRQLSNEQGLAGLAVRCWPEFFTDLGCAACGALSLLSGDLIPAACEADVHGVLTQLILQGVAECPVFDCDIVARDDELDALVLWHCGKAPLAMADPQSKPRAGVHSNRRLPLVMEFALRPGPVTIARLSAAARDYRLVTARGEMLTAEMSFTGTSGRCRFQNPAKQVMERILDEGLEHHLALAYGDSLSTLNVLAKLLALPVLQL